MSHTNDQKPRVAFFDFAGCEGCQLTVLDALQTAPELLDAIEIVEFREALSERSDMYQIAFVEGSCARPADEARLRQIRERADVVVALGACAHIGGVNALRNRQPLSTTRRIVYGDRADWYDTYDVRSIDKVIPVDVVIPGCPIERDEFVRTVRLLLQGRTPRPPDYPLCIECKLEQTVCLFERGQVCLGPITRAGCHAIGPAHGQSCDGCRGLVPNANLEAFCAVLEEHGMDREAADAMFALFLSNEVDSLPWRTAEAEVSA
jgi:coenzyme F420-reducing hydrogenase gamma subunit